MIKKVAFTMYPVMNIERARHFYEQVLGLDVGKISSEGRWIEYDLPQGGVFRNYRFGSGCSAKCSCWR